MKRILLFVLFATFLGILSGVKAYNISDLPDNVYIDLVLDFNYAPDDYSLLELGFYTHNFNNLVGTCNITVLLGKDDGIFTANTPSYIFNCSEAQFNYNFRFQNAGNPSYEWKNVTVIVKDDNATYETTYNLYPSLYSIVVNEAFYINDTTFHVGFGTTKATEFGLQIHDLGNNWWAYGDDSNTTFNPNIPAYELDITIPTTYDPAVFELNIDNIDRPDSKMAIHYRHYIYFAHPQPIFVERQIGDGDVIIRIPAYSTDYYYYAWKTMYYYTAPYLKSLYWSYFWDTSQPSKIDYTKQDYGDRVVYNITFNGYYTKAYIWIKKPSNFNGSLWFTGYRDDNVLVYDEQKSYSLINGTAYGDVIQVDPYLQPAGDLYYPVTGGTIITLGLNQTQQGCVTPHDDLVINQPGLVKICQGDYNIADGGDLGVIVIDADNVILDLNGAKIHGSGSGYGIYVWPHTNVTIMNGTIDNYDNNVRIEGCNDVTVTDMNVTNFVTHGVYMYDTNNSMIISNYFESPNNDNNWAFRFEGCNDILVKGNEVHDCYSGDWSCCPPTHGLKIIGNKFVNVQIALGIGDNNTNWVIANNTVVDIPDDWSSNGVYVFGYDGIIENNTIRCLGSGTGINFDGYSAGVNTPHNVSVNGNKVIDCFMGISMVKSYNITAIDNMVYNTTYYGFQLIDSNNFNILYNNITGSDRGIGFTNSSYGRIEGNIIDDVNYLYKFYCDNPYIVSCNNIIGRYNVSKVLLFFSDWSCPTANLEGTLQPDSDSCQPYIYVTYDSKDLDLGKILLHRYAEGELSATVMTNRLQLTMLARLNNGVDGFSYELTTERPPMNATLVCYSSQGGFHEVNCSDMNITYGSNVTKELLNGVDVRWKDLFTSLVNDVKLKFKVSALSRPTGSSFTSFVNMVFEGFSETLSLIYSFELPPSIGGGGAPFIGKYDITFHTRPAVIHVKIYSRDGKLLVEKDIRDGEKLTLEAGVYRLVATADGYEEQAIVLTVPNELEVSLTLTPIVHSFPFVNAWVAIGVVGLIILFFLFKKGI